MPAPATHTGICQLCGKRHMLPDGKLAKHGYTMDYGYFNGTCRGSDALPFEQSKELAERSLLQAAIRRDELLAQADAISMTGNDDGTVWARIERPSLIQPRQKVRMFEKARLDDRHVVAVSDGLRQQHHVYSDANGIVRSLQMAYSDHFRRSAREAEQYIDWQSDRVSNWAPQPLKRVEDEKARKTHVLRYVDGSGYVAKMYVERYAPAHVIKTPDLDKAARYTERGAKQAMGKARGYRTMEVVEA